MSTAGWSAKRWADGPDACQLIPRSSTALLLGRHEVSSLNVERHAGTAIHPRAGHFHLRTTEILREAGVEEAVRHRSVQQYHPDGGINNVESLAGRELGTFFANLDAGVEEFSPTVRAFIDQDALEPILRAHAEELGARLRYRVECEALVQDSEGVTATLHDLADDSRRTVRAGYVIAADGNRSPTREELGIAPPTPPVTSSRPERRSSASPAASWRTSRWSPSAFSSPRSRPMR